MNRLDNDEEGVAMKSLPERIMEYAEALPEATPISPAALLHRGTRGAVSQALSRLARADRLMRICHGVLMRWIQTRFGLPAPSLEKVLSALSELRSETIVPNGGDAANWLGLATQNTIRSIYPTSGPNVSCTLVPIPWNCSTHHAGSWLPHTERPGW